MRLFCIWNGGFRIQHIFANTIDEAIDMALASGHMRKRTGIRKWMEFTEADEADLPGTIETLKANVSGIGVFIEGQGWEIDGKLIAG